MREERKRKATDERSGEAPESFGEKLTKAGKAKISRKAAKAQRKDI
jgi:hypothetical protein